MNSETMSEYEAESQADRDAENKFEQLNDALNDMSIDILEAHVMLTRLNFLREKKAEYEKAGLIPTLELLIEDLEKEYENNN